MRREPARDRDARAEHELLATYWMSFEFAREPRGRQDDKMLARGVFQVMSLAAPYLEPPERALFDRLAERYIA